MDGRRSSDLVEEPRGGDSAASGVHDTPASAGAPDNVLADGVKVAEQTYAGPGTYTLESPPVLPAKPVTTLTIVVDKTFSVPGDRRELGIVLYGAGFR